MGPSVLDVYWINGLRAPSPGDDATTGTENSVPHGDVGIVLTRYT